MKKVLLLIICITLLSVTGCSFNNSKVSTDSKKFKSEYESLNNTKNEASKEQRSLSISNANPIVYITPKNLIKKVDNKDTFYVYFGSAYCPWCRSVIEKFLEVAQKNKIDKIYYVDIWDGDHKEILRDTYVLDEDNKLVLSDKGATEYQTLLKYFDNVLDDYTLTDSDGNQVPVGEKRIFAPTFIYVKNGKAQKSETGISSKQKDSRAKLSSDILKDEENKFKKFFSK